MMDGALYFFSGILVSLACCVLVPRLLVRAGFLDVPGERSSHARPTPKGGGVGMVLAFVLACVISGVPMLLWLPLAALAGLSFVNDLRGIEPKVRLAAQFAAAGAALGGAWWSGNATWHGLLLFPALFFVVATANCYNFMDGINGIAGVSGVTAFFCLAVFGASEAIPYAMQLSIMAVIGALIGFLPFNLPRARLFMGDAGSIFLGFLFAMSVCILARSWTDFFVLASFLYPFYADEAVTIVERVWRGESLLQPHRRHLYQFLANELGLPHWKVSTAYGLIQAVVAVLAVMAGQHGLWAVLGLDIALLGLWAGAHWKLKRRFFLQQKGA